MAYVNVNSKKVWKHDPDAVKTSKPKQVDRFSKYEIYVKDASGVGGVNKVGEITGTRSSQVQLRRELRAKLGLTGDRILLYSNGRLLKVGIDKGSG